MYHNVIQVYVDMTINGLMWDIENIQHITWHQVTQDEVEEVVNSIYIELKGRWKRDVVIGATNAGRVLKIVLELRDSYFYYVITAFDAKKEEIILYKQMKGDL